jgi:uncharacterized protein (DUF433 family)
MWTLTGVSRGKVIELPEDLGLPDGQQVTVTVYAVPQEGAIIVPKEPLPWWLQRLDNESSVRKGKYVVRGTQVLTDDLVAQMEQGRSDEQLLQAHPELTPADVAAVREYAKVPAEVRRLAGAWADEAEELEEYLEWNRRQKQVVRPAPWECEE